MYFVYIVECSDKTLYVGSTNDIAKRIHAHNHLKSGARYTKSRRPVTLKYSQKFRTLSKALSVEARFKRYSRAEKLALLRSK